MKTITTLEDRLQRRRSQLLGTRSGHCSPLDIELSIQSASRHTTKPDVTPSITSPYVSPYRPVEVPLSVGKRFAICLTDLGEMYLKGSTWKIQ